MPICLFVFFHKELASVFKSFSHALQHTHTPTHKAWKGRKSGRREGAKHELWILKDFPALQDCEKDREEDVRPKIYRGKIR